MSSSDLSDSLRKHKIIAKIAWLGLDFAGKTTTIMKITKGIFNEHTKRTMGMNVSEFDSENAHFMCWDLGGQDIFREYLWQSYINNSSGIVFVVDSNAPERFSEAKQEFWRWIIENPYVKEVPILILANKQDLPNVQSANDIANALDLIKAKSLVCTIMPSSAATGLNLVQGMDWITQHIIEMKKHQKIIKRP